MCRNLVFALRIFLPGSSGSHVVGRGIGLEGLIFVPQVPSEGDIHVLRHDIERQGFGLVSGMISAELAAEGVKQITNRVRQAFEGRNEDFVSLDSMIGKKWNATPPHWSGPRWGGCDKLGWIKSVGTGRLFLDWLPAPVEAAQRAAGPWVAGLSQTNLSNLRFIPERCSVKVAGCPELPAHLDLSRRGGYQVVIALVPLAFRVWPHSHRVSVHMGNCPSYLSILCFLEARISMFVVYIKPVFVGWGGGSPEGA